MKRGATSVKHVSGREQSRLQRKSRAGRVVRPPEASVTASYMVEAQEKARKKREVNVDKARRRKQREEYMALKAKAETKGDSDLHQNNQAPLFVGTDRSVVAHFARQMLCAELRRHGARAREIAPPALYAGCAGEDDLEKLSALMVEKAWVDPRNVAIWGIVLIEWRGWQVPKEGPNWVRDDGKHRIDIDYTCAPINISDPKVMEHYIAGKKRFEVRSGAVSAPARELRRSAVSATRGTKMYLRCNKKPYAGWLLELEVQNVLK